MDSSSHLIVESLISVPNLPYWAGWTPLSDLKMWMRLSKWITILVVPPSSSHLKMVRKQMVSRQAASVSLHFYYLIIPTRRPIHIYWTNLNTLNRRGDSQRQLRCWHDARCIGPPHPASKPRDKGTRRHSLHKYISGSRCLTWPSRVYHLCEPTAMLGWECEYQCWCACRGISLASLMRLREKYYIA